ncbi:MAG: ferritin-like domain-containing protein [Thermoleophilaceae bacterium]
MADDIDTQLTKYLTDAHSIEEQALAQLRTAPDIAGDPEISKIFEEHLTETEEQERLVRERLAAREGSPSRIKDAVMAAGGKGFVLFAKSQPDTPGKLVTHAYSYEHLELGAYGLLRRVAERAGDTDTTEVAQRIAGEEQAMADRLAANFDRAADAALEEAGQGDIEKQLVKYLADAHAIESQAEQLLSRGPKIAGDPELERLYEEHLEETKGHKQRIEQRLEAHGASPNSLQDAAMRLGALNWGTFFQAQPDTPGKLACFAFAFEHLEIGGYEQLRRVAERAGDTETVDTVNAILSEERAAAQKIAGAFGRAAEASLSAVGVA